VATLFIPRPVTTKKFPFQLTLEALDEKSVAVARPVQLIPSGLVIIVKVPLPTAAHKFRVGENATPKILPVIGLVLVVQVIPFGLVCKSAVDVPPRTKRPEGFEAMEKEVLLACVERAVQVIPSGLVKIPVVESPTAIQHDWYGYQMTAKFVTFATAPREIHVIASTLVATRFVPSPTATQREPFHATPYPVLVTGLLLDVQTIPSGLVATVIEDPDPTATQIEPFHATAYTFVKMDCRVAYPAQTIPSRLDARIFVPEPPAIS
jgi:hypothetical protein